MLRKMRGLGQIPLIIGLVIMAIAVPIATKLVEQRQDTRKVAAKPSCPGTCTNSCPAYKVSLDADDYSCSSIWSICCANEDYLTPTPTPEPAKPSCPGTCTNSCPAYKVSLDADDYSCLAIWSICCVNEDQVPTPTPVCLANGATCSYWNDCCSENCETNGDSFGSCVPAVSPTPVEQCYCEDNTCTSDCSVSTTTPVGKFECQGSCAAPTPTWRITPCNVCESGTCELRSGGVEGETCTTNIGCEPTGSSCGGGVPGAYEKCTSSAGVENGACCDSIGNYVDWSNCAGGGGDSDDWHAFGIRVVDEDGNVWGGNVGSGNKSSWPASAINCGTRMGVGFETTRDITLTGKFESSVLADRFVGLDLKLPTGACSDGSTYVCDGWSISERDGSDNNDDLEVQGAWSSTSGCVTSAFKPDHYDADVTFKIRKVPPVLSCSGFSVSPSTSVTVGEDVTVGTYTVSEGAYGLVRYGRVANESDRLIASGNIRDTSIGAEVSFDQDGWGAFEVNTYSSPNCEYLCTAGGSLYKNTGTAGDCYSSSWQNLGTCSSNCSAKVEVAVGVAPVTSPSVSPATSPPVVVPLSCSVTVGPVGVNGSVTLSAVGVGGTARLWIEKNNSDRTGFVEIKLVPAVLTRNGPYPPNDSYYYKVGECSDDGEECNIPAQGSREISALSDGVYEVHCDVINGVGGAQCSGNRLGGWDSCDTDSNASTKDWKRFIVSGSSVSPAPTSTPRSVLPMSCTVKGSGSWEGSSITPTGNGYNSAARFSVIGTGGDVRLWVSREDNSTDGMPFPESWMRTDDGKNYYHFKTCDGKYRECSESWQSVVDLPGGNYRVHCDVVNGGVDGDDQCSGNIATWTNSDWPRCGSGGDDYLEIPVAGPTAAPATPTSSLPTPTPGECNGVCIGVLYGCTDPGQVDVGQMDCPTGNKCCDTSGSVTPTATPTPRFTCAEKCGSGMGDVYSSCYTPVVEDGMTCTVSGPPVTGETIDCQANNKRCYCAICYTSSPTPTPIATATPALVCESQCYFGQTQCVRDTSNLTGGRCIGDGDLPTGVCTGNSEDYWDWAYCRDGVSPTATSGPANPTATSGPSVPTNTPPAGATVTITPSKCTACSNGADRSIGNASCNLDKETGMDIVDLEDKEIWREEYYEGGAVMGVGESRNDWEADFNCDSVVDLDDKEKWRVNYILYLETLFD